MSHAEREKKESLRLCVLGAGMGLTAAWAYGSWSGLVWCGRGCGCARPQKGASATLLGAQSEEDPNQGATAPPLQTVKSTQAACGAPDSTRTAALSPRRDANRSSRADPQPSRPLDPVCDPNAS